MSISEPRDGLPPMDLAGVFTRTTRADGLRGRLAAPTAPTSAPHTPAPSQDQPPTRAAAAAADQHVAALAAPPTKAPTPGKRAGKAKRAAGTSKPETTSSHAESSAEAASRPVSSGDSDGGSRPVVIYTPHSVRERLTAHRRRTGLTLTEVLLDAFDATHRDLPDLYAARAPQQRQDSLFNRPASRRRGEPEDPLVQVYVSTTAGNLEIIDAIVATVAPGDSRARSRVAALALDTYLPPSPPPSD